jgi:hypothetical protein
MKRRQGRDQVVKTTWRGKQGGKEHPKERTQSMIMDRKRVAFTEGVRNHPILDVVLCCCYCHRHCRVLAVAFLLQLIVFSLS